MGTIVNTIAYIEPVVIISLSDLRDDGTVSQIKKKIQLGKLYQVIVYDSITCKLTKLKGKFAALDYDYTRRNREWCNSRYLSYIYLDCSEESNSKEVRIPVSDIKAIDEIQEI